MPESDSDLPKLKDASKITIDLIRSINNEVGKKDDLERLEWLEEHVNVKGVGFKFRSTTNIMGPRRLMYYGPFVKESNGKELYGFLFNDSFLIIESYESLHNEIFRVKCSKLQLYKQPFLLDTVFNVQSKMGSIGSDYIFQMQMGDKEYSFKTANPALKNEWIKQMHKCIEAYRQKKRSITQSISACKLCVYIVQIKKIYPLRHNTKNNNILVSKMVLKTSNKHQKSVLSSLNWIIFVDFLPGNAFLARIDK